MKIACDQATQSASGLSNNTKPAQVIKARVQRYSIDCAGFVLLLSPLALWVAWSQAIFIGVLYTMAVTIVVVMILSWGELISRTVLIWLHRLLI
jgi:hypothetical protein